MINLGSLCNLTNEEFLRELVNVGEKSPIISELCKRLDKINDFEKEIEEINNKTECPVCMASLHAEMDLSNKLFILRTK